MENMAILQNIKNRATTLSRSLSSEYIAKDMKSILYTKECILNEALSTVDSM
jgi:hypothetical protein